jgi:hypothetical protein
MIKKFSSVNDTFPLREYHFTVGAKEYEEILERKAKCRLHRRIYQLLTNSQPLPGTIYFDDSLEETLF